METAHLMEDAPRVNRLQYSPWLTANLTLDRRPRELGGVGSGLG